MAIRKLDWNRDVESMVSTVIDAKTKAELHKFHMADIKDPKVLGFMALYGHDKLVDDRTSTLSGDVSKKVPGMIKVHNMLANGDLKKAREAAGERVTYKSIAENLNVITNPKKRAAAVEALALAGIDIDKVLAATKKAN